MHGGPFPFRVPHVAADVFPERFDLRLQLGAGLRDVTAARRINGAGCWIQAHQPRDRVRFAQVVRLDDQLFERIAYDFLLFGTQRPGTFGAAGELSGKGNGREKRQKSGSEGSHGVTRLRQKLSPAEDKNSV